MLKQSRNAECLSNRALDRAYRSAVRSFPKAPPLAQRSFNIEGAQQRLFYTPGVLFVNYLKPIACSIKNREGS